MDTDVINDQRSVGHPGEWADPYCLGYGEAERLRRFAPWSRLLVMGDSIALGTGDAVAGYVDQSWADRLADVLGGVYQNLGVFGARVADARKTQLEPALALRPDLAFVTVGANDAFRRSFAAPDVEAVLECIVAPLTAAGALVVTFGCFDLGQTSFLPPDQRQGLSDRLHALGQLTEKVSHRHGGVHVDFLSHPALDDGLMSADRIHINRRGHAIVAAEVIRSLANHLAPRAYWG
jgi:lysophospholipase L1-like esterase